MPKDVIPVVVGADPGTYEDVHVHAIYDDIADHFSSTRYKPWPIIVEFLSEIPTGWVGLDAGTGNGKYLSLPPHPPGKIWSIGLDRSINLLRLARSAGGVTREVVLGNVLDYCWRKGCFDFAISIATIHHLTTSERRRVAVQRLLEAVSPNHGRVLIYVWAIEQDELSKRSIPTNGKCSTSGQDVLVPWVSSDREQNATNTHNGVARVYNRYYHMFAKEELIDLVKGAAQASGLELGPQPGGETGARGVEIVREGWERSNYYIELRLWQVR